MSADHVPHTADAVQAVSDPPQVEAEYAEWAHVLGPDEHQPLPSLVLGNHSRELHLELTVEQLDELLVDLAGQVQGSGDAVAEEPDRDRPTWASRAGARALSASGWRTTDQWWRTSTSNTRIIVVGAIVAVMVLGLLVTF